MAVHVGQTAASLIGALGSWTGCPAFCLLSEGIFSCITSSGFSFHVDFYFLGGGLTVVARVYTLLFLFRSVPFPSCLLRVYPDLIELVEHMKYPLVLFFPLGLRFSAVLGGVWCGSTYCSFTPVVMIVHTTVVYESGHSKRAYVLNVSDGFDKFDNFDRLHERYRT